MSGKPVFDPPSADPSEQEEGTRLRPRFDAAGLVTAVVTDHASGELLMVAHMNERALEATLSTGLAHSRNALWKKGETSGALQSVREVRVDCDQDAVWLKVAVAKPDDTCHTSRTTCFYRVVAGDGQSLAVRETGDGPLAS